MIDKGPTDGCEKIRIGRGRDRQRMYHPQRHIAVRRLTSRPPQGGQRRWRTIYPDGHRTAVAGHAKAPAADDDSRNLAVVDDRPAHRPTERAVQQTVLARAHDQHQRVLRRCQQGERRGLVDHPPDDVGRWVAGRESTKCRLENRSSRRRQPITICGVHLSVDEPGLAVRGPCQHGGHRPSMHGRGVPGPPQRLDGTRRAVHADNDPW